MRQTVESKDERIRNNNRRQEREVDRKGGIVVVCVSGKKWTEKERSRSWKMSCFIFSCIFRRWRTTCDLFHPAIHYSTCTLRPPSPCSRLHTWAHKMRSLQWLTFCNPSSSCTLSGFLAHHCRLRFFFIISYKIVIVPLAARNAPEVPVCPLKPSSVGSQSIPVGGKQINECKRLQINSVCCVWLEAFVLS